MSILSNCNEKYIKIYLTEDKIPSNRTIYLRLGGPPCCTTSNSKAVIIPPISYPSQNLPNLCLPNNINLQNYTIRVSYENTNRACGGGAHTCNRAKFIVKINNRTIGIANLNNAGGPQDPGGPLGGSRESSIIISDPILTNKQTTMILECAYGECNCHSGIATVRIYDTNNKKVFDACIINDLIMFPTCNNVSISNTANISNVTTSSVGSNGAESYYGTYDQTGNVMEWNDLNNTISTYRGLRGGSYKSNIALSGSSLFRQEIAPFQNWQKGNIFRQYQIGDKVIFDGQYYECINNHSGTYAEPYPSDDVLNWIVYNDFNVGFRIATLYNPLNLNNFVTIADMNNTDDTNGYGGVSYPYQINKYEVTNCEYVEFLNSVGKNDDNRLYGPAFNAIQRIGSFGNYIYIGSGLNQPINKINWYQAARYCNWLHNNKKSGLQDNTTTESGVYTLNNTNPSILPIKNISGSYWIPSENEWYKAAYYDPSRTEPGSQGSYWSYATKSDTLLNSMIDSSGNGPIKSQYSCASSTLLSLPSKPLNVTGIPYSSEVLLSWTAPLINGGSNIIDYVIQYSGSGTQSWITFADNVSNDAQSNIINLTNGVSYAFRVAAINNRGIGDWSDITNFITPNLGNVRTTANINTYTITSVGTNGPPSYYGVFDVDGNIPHFVEDRGIAVGSYYTDSLSTPASSPSAYRTLQANATSTLNGTPIGLRICSITNSIILNQANMSNVMDMGNNADTNLYGRVDYQYSISKFPVTYCEYALFLNSTAKDNLYNIYDLELGNSLTGPIISRSGNSPNFSYSVNPIAESNVPISNITWINALRYCNWLHNWSVSNIMPTGAMSTASGAYNLLTTIPDFSNIDQYKSRDARYWICSFNEWYKAAYYDPTKGGYWKYGTKSNIQPISIDSNLVNSANLNGPFASIRVANTKFPGCS